MSFLLPLAEVAGESAAAGAGEAAASTESGAAEQSLTRSGSFNQGQQDHNNADKEKPRGISLTIGSLFGKSGETNG